MANYPGVRNFTGGDTLLADHLDELWTAFQALHPVGSLQYLVRAATTVETFVNAAYLECNGVSVLRATYPDLNTVLSALSYPFGSASGTTMTLPDLQGRNLVAMASGGHVDVNALADSDGLAKASRTPKEGISVSLSGTTGTDGAHTHTQTAGIAGGGSSGTLAEGNVQTGSSGSHSHSFSDSGTDTLSGNFLVAGCWFIKAVA